MTAELAARLAGYCAGPTPGQEAAALRAVAKRALEEGWSVEEARVVFEMLGLAPTAPRRQKRAGSSSPPPGIPASAPGGAKPATAESDGTAGQRSATAPPPPAHREETP